MTRTPLPAEVLTSLPSAEPVLAWTVFNGSYPGWSEHAPLLQPLVDSSQIQLGNHDFIARTFGVDPHPYYRPPNGSHRVTSSSGIRTSSP